MSELKINWDKLVRDLSPGCYNEIGQMLSVDVGKNYRDLAGDLGFRLQEVEIMKLKKPDNPGHQLLHEWSLKENATARVLKFHLDMLGRQDILRKLEKHLTDPVNLIVVVRNEGTAKPFFDGIVPAGGDDTIRDALQSFDKLSPIVCELEPFQKQDAGILDEKASNFMGRQVNLKRTRSCDDTGNSMSNSMNQLSIESPRNRKGTNNANNLKMNIAAEATSTYPTMNYRHQPDSTRVNKLDMPKPTKKVPSPTHSPRRSPDPSYTSLTSTTSIDSSHGEPSQPGAAPLGRRSPPVGGNDGPQFFAENMQARVDNPPRSQPALMLNLTGPGARPSETELSPRGPTEHDELSQASMGSTSSETIPKVVTGADDDDDDDVSIDPKKLVRDSTTPNRPRKEYADFSPEYLTTASVRASPPNIPPRVQTRPVDRAPDPDYLTTIFDDENLPGFHRAAVNNNVISHLFLPHMANDGTYIIRPSRGDPRIRAISVVYRGEVVNYRVHSHQTVSGDYIQTQYFLFEDERDSFSSMRELVEYYRVHRIIDDGEDDGPTLKTPIVLPHSSQS